MDKHVTSNILLKMLTSVDINKTVSFFLPLQAWVQQATCPIANGYRNLCWAMIIFAFVARLAVRKVKLEDHAQSNMSMINSVEEYHLTHQLSFGIIPIGQ